MIHLKSEYRLLLRRPFDQKDHMTTQRNTITHAGIDIGLVITENIPFTATEETEDKNKGREYVECLRLELLVTTKQRFAEFIRNILNVVTDEAQREEIMYQLYELEHEQYTQPDPSRTPLRKSFNTVIVPPVGANGSSSKAKAEGL